MGWEPQERDPWGCSEQTHAVTRVSCAGAELAGDRLSAQRAGNCCLSASLPVFPDFIVFCLIESHTHMHTKP